MRFLCSKTREALSAAHTVDSLVSRTKQAFVRILCQSSQFLREISGARVKMRKLGTLSLFLASLLVSCALAEMERKKHEKVKKNNISFPHNKLQKNIFYSGVPPGQVPLSRRRQGTRQEARHQRRRT